MRITDEQARLAARCLRMTSMKDSAGIRPRDAHDIELVQRLTRALAYEPDTCSERIAMGREMLDSLPTSEEVAGKILSRIVSDSLR